MTSSEWESLCDKCGKCCVIKLEDFDTQDIYYTNVSCKLLCEKTALCKDYINRKSIVPDCTVLSSENLKNLKWMPETCAYKLIDQGKKLPKWHPLISGNEDEIVDSGMGGDFSATAAGYAGVAEMDPMEQYVQQLIAQGYPEETARAYAQQYAGHFQQ